MSKMCTLNKPCRSCPWRVDQDARGIPGYEQARAESLRGCSPDEKGFGPSYGAPIFACHQSKDGGEIACAGWLASVGNAHPNVRLAVMREDLQPEALAPRKGWPELHKNYQDVLKKLTESDPER